MAGVGIGRGIHQFGGARVHGLSAAHHDGGAQLAEDALESRAARDGDHGNVRGLPAAGVPLTELRVLQVHVLDVDLVKNAHLRSER